MSTMVDLMPNISPTGDFKKISDKSTYNNNNKVATTFKKCYNFTRISEGVIKCLTAKHFIINL